jgi:MoaA/NifB/PqqE/SkfB family radical SAM enzyme
MLSSETAAAYGASRDPGVDPRVLCHAPFVSLNFDQSGRVTACCYNRFFVLGTYPGQSVREIWTGERAQALRQAFLRDAEVPGCELCFHQLASGNFAGALMRNFDRYSGEAGYGPGLDMAAPRILEFEISNTCNLECVMCSGHWSSSIRANREKLPPLRSPYDHAFVAQLEEFLPSIAGAKFLGGEPFLIERYYEIWESIRRLNPGARLSITTNGTVLPARARDLLEDLRADIVVSLDGITADTYEAVRKNARFDDVMGHLEYFIAYTRRRGTQATLAVCPMTHNWRELPALLQFCERRQLNLYFNTVTRPAESSLASLAPAELADVVAVLEAASPGGAGARAQWDSLLSQLRAWREEKLELERRCAEIEARARKFAEVRAGGRTGWTLPESFDRLVSPLVRAVRIDGERATAAHADFREVIFRMPGVPWKAGEEPSAREILLAMHVFCRFLDAEDGDGTASDGGVLHAEQRRLHEYLDGLASDEGAAARPRLEGLGRWMGERIKAGEGEALVRFMRMLLGSFDGDVGLSLDFHGEMQRRLPGGLALLRGRGLDEDGCAKVARHFERLVQEQLRSLPEISPSPPATETDAAPVRPPIRNLEDLGHVLDAMYVFHVCSRPSVDHERFRRRLESCLEALASSGRAAVACQSLETRDLTLAYGYLANAPEEWLVNTIQSLA